MLVSTLFVVSFLLHRLLLLFLQYNLELHQRYLSFFVLTLQNIIRTLLYFSKHCCTIVLLIFMFLNAKYIHCSFFVCWKGPIIILVPFCNNFNIDKHHLYLVFCFVLSKYILSTIFQNFKLKIHQPYLRCCSFHSKNTKHTMFLIRAKNVTFFFSCCFFVFKTSIVPLSLLGNL